METNIKEKKNKKKSVRLGSWNLKYKKNNVHIKN